MLGKEIVAKGLEIDHRTVPVVRLVIDVACAEVEKVIDDLGVKGWVAELEAQLADLDAEGVEHVVVRPVDAAAVVQGKAVALLLVELVGKPR